MTRILAIVLALSVCAAASAQTAGDDQSSAQSSAQAKRHFERGLAHFNLQEYRQAITEFEEAYRLRPDPVFLYNLGQAYRLADDPDRALYFYRTYLRTSDNVPNRAEVQARIAELEKLQSARRAMAKPPNSAIKPDENAASAPAAATAAPPAAATTPAAPPAAATTTTTTTAPQVASAPEETPAVATQPSRPLVKRAWFWVAVGGAAVVVAAGIALGVTFGTRAHDPSATYGVAYGN